MAVLVPGISLWTNGTTHLITLLRKKDTHFTVDGKYLSATLLIGGLHHGYITGYLPEMD